MTEVNKLYQEFWSRQENIIALFQNKPMFQTLDEPTSWGYSGNSKCINCNQLSIQHDHYGFCK